MKKVRTLLLLTLLITAVAGCGSKPEASPPADTTGTDISQSQDATKSNEPANTEPQEKQKDNDKATASTGKDGDVTGVSDSKDTKGSTSSQEKSETIKVFYTDEQLTELKSSSQSITYKDDLGKYEAAFTALQNSKDSKLFSLWSKIKLNSMKMKDGQLTIDISMPDEARLGSDGELFALDSLKQTFFQFNEVKSIELLVDGQQLESLMGHADLDHPITRK